MNNRSDKELLNLCTSNDLSYGALKETINLLGPRLSTQNPSCFYQACGNENVTLEIVQLLHNTLPEALQLRDDDGYLPIHYLSGNEYLDDTNSIDILRFMLDIDPNLPREVEDDRGRLPIHVAVMDKSSAFCKELIDAYPESLRIESRDGGELPIHLACFYGNRDDTADTIQYLLELDPELVNPEDSDGSLPIHYAAEYGRTKLIELLLKFDPDAASYEVNNGSHRLPLHLACGAYNPNLSTIQALYDAYPDALFAGDEDGDTPFDHAEGNQQVIEFLQTQLEYAEQSQNTSFTIVDDDGWLPLHRALKDNAPLGSIKLLKRANPVALNIADREGEYPVHIACKFSSVKVVKYLVELAGDILNYVDAKNNSLLHYACRGGSLNVVKYLLETNVPSVSERNNDNKLAIHLLFECGSVLLDRDSLEYVETIHQLLLANPEVVRDFMTY